MRFDRPLPRRAFVKTTAAGLASTAHGLYPLLAHAAELNDGQPLAPQPPHFEPKAKRLIFIFLTGGFSHVDTFDYKPLLKKHHGKMVSSHIPLRPKEKLPLMASPFRFRRYGQSGLWVSELFSNLGAVADELCVIRSLHMDFEEHFQSTLAMHTGSTTIPMPSIGAWLSYGLGTFNRNLPSYVVVAEHMPYAGAQVWANQFLPPYHQGVRIVPGDRPIPHLRSQARSVTLAELEFQMLQDINRHHASLRPADLKLRGRTRSFETARGMMQTAPGVLDISQETAGTLATYGVQPGDKKSFGYQCLLARRLVEQGVRVVELIDSPTYTGHNWDSHADIQHHRPRAQHVDQPVAALVSDLKQRGLLDETLIAICTEFGRTPWVNNAGSPGRNHWGKSFTCLLAGAGVRGGMTYGKTDQYGSKIVDEPVHLHDYHATILHLMGIDHRRLIYRYSGRDFRLTDVHGNVIKNILV